MNNNKLMDTRLLNINNKLELVAFIAIICCVSSTINQAVQAQEDKFKFVVLGDMGCTSDTEANAAEVTKLNPDLVIVPGDLSYDTDLSCWTDIIAPFQAKTKVVLGNHDGKLEDEVLKTFGLTSPFYSFDFKNAHFLMLNTEDDISAGSEQFQFTESDLKKSTKDWKFVIYHKPHFTTESEHAALAGGAEFNAMLAASGADAVFTGHNHNYQRSFPLDANANPVQKEVTNGEYKNLDKKAIIYYVSGGGGRDLYDLASAEPYTAFQVSTFGLMDIDVNGNNLATQFIDTANNNKVIDKVTITNENVPPPPPVDPVCGPNEHLENHVCVPNTPPPPPPIDSQILINNNIQNTTSYGDYKRADYTHYYKVSNMFDNIINDVSYWSQNGPSGFKVILNTPLDRPLCNLNIGVLEPLNQKFNLKLYDSQNKVLVNFDGIVDNVNEELKINGCVNNVKSMTMDFQTPIEQWTIIPEIKLFTTGTPPPPPIKEVCNDGIDNDGDGLIDQADIVDCPTTPPPPPPPQPLNNGTLNITNGTATINAQDSSFMIFINNDTKVTADYKGENYPVDSPLVITSEGGE